MTVKNFGPAVSGYLDPDGRSFENVVTQSGKPVLDKELNLGADLSSGLTQAILKKTIPSGWIGNEFLDQISSLLGLYQPTVDLNTVATNPLLAHVNGWVIPVVHTNMQNANKISLGAPPVGAGAKRTDLVILEVWRRLIGPATGDGKSQTGRIFLNGNVKVASGDDALLNLADDLQDGVFGAETTKRVQVQYRLRVIPGVDVFGYPNGLDDPSIVANSVPATPGAPDGVATLFGYTNQSAAGDSGLWRAGDGNPANTLGTVDGFIYSIPLLAVFRRNSTAFDRNTNLNGAGVSPSPSGRPDGYFCNVFQLTDIADLRNGVSLQGWKNDEEILRKNFNAILDNVYLTEWEQGSLGGGQNGHTILISDEIGVSNANGGDGVVNGDTPGANFIGQFDYVRRKFSDRVIYEVMTVRVVPNTAAVSTATWQVGTVVTLDPTALAPYPYAAFNFPAFAPSQTRLIDVLKARILGSGVGKQTAQVGVQDPVTGGYLYNVKSVSGLGVFPMAPIVITLDSLPLGAALTDEPMYIDLLVAYPGGMGLTRTSSDTFGANTFAINNPGQLSASAPTSFASTTGLTVDRIHREANLEYITSSLSFSFNADFSVGAQAYVMPEQVQTLGTVTVNGSPVGGFMDNTGRVLTLNSPPAPGDAIVVGYTARRPIPQTGVQFTLYYNSRAPQTIREGLLPNSLPMVPRYISPTLWSLTVGSGSRGEGFPFPTAYVHTGALCGTFANPFNGDHDLDGSTEIDVANFSSSTGMLNLPTFIPYVPTEGVTLTRTPGSADIEGRTYYPAVPNNGYLPNTFAQPLSDARRHKVIFPTLMELTTDTGVGKKGTLVMVLFTRWAPADPSNSISFDPNQTDNLSCASVYRVNGNLLVRRALCRQTKTPMTLFRQVRGSFPRAWFPQVLSPSLLQGVETLQPTSLTLWMPTLQAPWVSMKFTRPRESPSWHLREVLTTANRFLTRSTS